MLPPLGKSMLHLLCSASVASNPVQRTGTTLIANPGHLQHYYWQVEQTWAMPNALWAPWSFSIFFDMSNCLSSTPCLAETERSPAGRNAKAWSVHPETATPWSLVSTRWNLSKNTNTTTPENKPPRQPMSRRHPAPDPGAGQPDVRGTCRPNATAPTAQTKETHGGTCRPTVEGVYHF